MWVWVRVCVRYAHIVISYLGPEAAHRKCLFVVRSSALLQRCLQNVGFCVGRVYACDVHMMMSY
jgi:hypothetical protein